MRKLFYWVYGVRNLATLYARLLCFCFDDLVSPHPGRNEVRDDDVERVVAPGEEEEHYAGQGIEERQPVQDEEGGWSV